ncbi:hypothetical protein Tco_1018494 [Tanacetum coccineum]|uniref:Uncharacterized protein n=1 Tax=Tanacetum coccineum TaxID=301880 RepID=A0ABQ5FUV7_9ASTR
MLNQQQSVFGIVEIIHCNQDNLPPIRFGLIRNRRNMEMEPDIENMMISEYLEYKAAKERRLWDDVRSRRSPTNYNEADVDSFHRNKRAENMKRMGHDIVQDSIWEQDDNSKEDQEEDGNDGDTFDMWDITVEER